MRDHDHDHNPIHCRDTVTNVETLPQRNHVRDPNHNPVHCRETVTNVETFPQKNNLVVQDHDLKFQHHLKFQRHHHVEILYCQGYCSRLHQSIIFMIITQNIST